MFFQVIKDDFLVEMKVKKEFEVLLVRLIDKFEFMLLEFNESVEYLIFL